MTTKKKTTTKAKTEPAAVTKTVKASKKAAPQPTVKVIATMPEIQEGPVAPTVAAAMAAKAEAVVAPAKEKQVLTVGMFQKALYEKGFYGGHWDGHYGPMTRSAVCHFQAANGIAVDGEPSAQTLAALGF